MSEITQEPKFDPSTHTAQEMFAAVLRDRIQAGALERAIEKKVDDLINSTADDVFRSYSDVGKALNKKLTASIMPQIQNIDDLPVYHDFVMNRIKLAAQNFYDNRLMAAVDAELKEVFSELPEQTTLSWLIEQVKEQAKEDSDGEHITLIIEDKSREWSWSKPGDSVSLYLDKNEDADKYNCEFDIHLSKNKQTGHYDILGIRVSGSKPGERLSVGRIYGIEKVLFNLYAMKGQIELDKGFDADDYDTGYEREHCHCD